MYLRVLPLCLSLALILSACQSTDPSPGALADAPEATALDNDHRPGLVETREQFRAALALVDEHNLASLPLSEMIVRLGELYIGSPYIIGPLDGFGSEVVVARLDSFDCFTFIEAMMAISRGVAEGDTTFEGYLRRTEEQRYRNGRAEDYASRLHYFTEWIYRNAERGLVRDVSAEVGGVAFPKRYGFMTAHREAYPALEDDAQFQEIARIEQELNHNIELHYIPQDRISDSYNRLQHGDLIAMSTEIEGLDVTHTGIVYRHADGGVGMLHAGTARGVTIETDLQEYVQGIRVQSGIIVARVIDPRG